MAEYGPIIRDTNYQSPTFNQMVSNPAYTGAPVQTSQPTPLTNLQKLSIGLYEGTIKNQGDVNALYGSNPQMSRSVPTPTPPPDPLASLSPEQRAEFSKQFSIGLSKGQLSDQASVDAFKSSFAKQALGGSVPSIYTNQPTTFGAPAGASATSQNNVAGVAGGGLRSRYGTQDELDAESYLGSFKAPETEEQIQARKLKENQSRIDSINNYYQELVYGQQRVNEQSDREANAQAVLSGLQGSTEAGGMMRESQQRGQREIGKIQAEKTMQIQQLYADIQKDAYTAYRDQLSDARQSAGDVLAMRDARESKASSQAQVLAQSGIDIEKLAQQDPKTYQYLEQSVGGPEMLKALFTLNRPKDSIIDKKIEGGKYIIAYQKPDGSVRIESVDLGLPTGYNKTVDAGDKIVAIPDNWDGDPSKLVTINKGLTPSQAGAQGVGGTYTKGQDPVVDAWIDQVNAGSVKLNQVPKNLQSKVAVGLTGDPASITQSQTNILDGLDIVDKILNSPGLKGATGGTAWMSLIPATEARTVKNQVDRLVGLLTLNAIKQMKGLGALSDAEGARLEKSVATLNDRYIKEEDYKAELTRVKQTLQKAKANLPSGVVGNDTGAGSVIPAGTDGASYGYPGYVSDGTQWVQK